MCLQAIAAETETAALLEKLEAAIEHARDAGISMSRAKKLLKDVQAQAAATNTAARLKDILSRCPCGSGLLKVAIYHRITSDREL